MVGRCGCAIPSLAGHGAEGSPAGGESDLAGASGARGRLSCLGHGAGWSSCSGPVTGNCDGGGAGRELAVVCLVCRRYTTANPVSGATVGSRRGPLACAALRMRRSPTRAAGQGGAPSRTRRARSGVSDEQGTAQAGTSLSKSLVMRRIATGGKLQALSGSVAAECSRAVETVRCGTPGGLRQMEAPASGSTGCTPQTRHSAFPQHLHGLKHRQGRTNLTSSPRNE